MAAVVLLSVARRGGLEVVGPAPYPTKSRTPAAVSQSLPQESAALEVTSATFPLVPLIAIDPSGVGGGKRRGPARARRLLDEVVRARRQGAGERGRRPGRSGRAGVLHRPAVERHRLGAAVVELDEVVGQRRTRVAAAPVDLADHDVGRDGTAPTSVTDDNATALVAINDATTALTTVLMASPLGSPTTCSPHNVGHHA